MKLFNQKCDFIIIQQPQYNFKNELFAKSDINV